MVDQLGQEERLRVRHAGRHPPRYGIRRRHHRPHRHGPDRHRPHGNRPHGNRPDRHRPHGQLLLHGTRVEHGHHLRRREHRVPRRHTWQAKWWTRDEAPAPSDWGVWKDLGAC
ncbi:hypothetical protein NKG05_05525 [Oerskovia sp. M15]